MQRDSRIGRDHWSGCHSFSNIICDGKNLSDNQPREGGLKMGGTYWYYYKLDDDIEFHNSVEPSTTQCPLLPGQLINELHVPVVLSGNRSRNASVSSTSSERRTMNPSDKFINPRPVPKPELSRLKTSPVLSQSPWSSNNTPLSTRSGRSGTATSEPGSADTVRLLRAQKKPSLDAPSRSNSRGTSPASALSNGLRSAFRSLRSPRSGSPDARSEDRVNLFDRLLDSEERSRSEGNEFRKGRSVGSSRDPSPNPRLQAGSLDHDLVFRKLMSSPDGSIESVIPSSFHAHRRQRSTSREPSSLRNSLLLEDTDAAPLREVGYPSKQPLSTLKEVASAQNTPGFPTGLPATSDLEKRLPTLPSSPSSAYPDSSAEEHQGDRGSMDIENLTSHFSTTTIDTSSSIHSSPAEEDTARFSGFSSNYADTARSSMYATSFIDDEPMSALLGPGATTPRRENLQEDDETEFEETPPRGAARRDDSLPTMLSSSTVSSTTVSSLSTSPSDYAPAEDRWGRRASPERFSYQHYRLPGNDHGSEITLKQPSQESVLRSDHPPTANPFGLRKPSIGKAQNTLPHSSNMQQLIDELSYLGDMIHQN